MCLIVDELRVANWQRSKDGSKRNKAPKPISPLAQQDKIKVGDPGGRTNEEVLALLRQRRPGKSRVERVAVGDPLPRAGRR